MSLLSIIFCNFHQNCSFCHFCCKSCTLAYHPSSHTVCMHSAVSFHSLPNHCFHYFCHFCCKTFTLSSFMSLQSTIVCNFHQNRSFCHFCCKSCTLSSFISLPSGIFCNFCQNRCFRHFCRGLWTLSCHCTQQFFVILVKIIIFTIRDFRPSHALICHCTQQFFCNFHQNCCFHLFHHFCWGL